MSDAMWYIKGTFYEVPTTHINFFLDNYKLFGFTRQEKEEMCVKMGLPKNVTSCPEQSDSRTDLLIDVLKKGAIRIRFYGTETSVQTYSHKNKMNMRELKNCVIDGLGKCFGHILTVMDCFGWGMELNDMGWGDQIEDFISSSAHKPKYKCVFSSGKVFQSDGRNRNEKNLETLLSHGNIADCIVNGRYVSIGKLIESNIRLYDLLKGKHAEKGYCIVSACRGTDSDDPKDVESNRLENKRRTKQLASDIKNAGYSYMPVYGGYIEDENGEVLEASFVIFNYDNRGNSGDFNDLMSFAISMCGKYNQDSVLICEPGKVPAYYDRNGKVVSEPSKSSDKVKINDRNEPYFTKLKDKSKRFTYDIAFPEDDELTSSLARVLSGYDYLRRKPQTYSERHRRWYCGEVFI